MSGIGSAIDLQFLEEFWYVLPKEWGESDAGEDGAVGLFGDQLRSTGVEDGSVGDVLFFELRTELDELIPRFDPQDDFGEGGASPTGHGVLVFWEVFAADHISQLPVVGQCHAGGGVGALGGHLSGTHLEVLSSDEVLDRVSRSGRRSVAFEEGENHGPKIT